MSDYMPVQLILEILQRLPVKSLLRFRSVCKSWNTLISHPSFISAHLQASLSNNNTPFLLLKYRKNGKYGYFLHYDIDGFEEFKQLQFFPFRHAAVYSVVGSCNGLICVLLYDMNFVLWNPSIQKYISLPKPKPSITYVWSYKFGFCFGFDSRTNDYKVLIVGTEDDESCFELFSLNGNCWKRVTAVYPKYAFGGHRSLPFVNGVVHWLGYRERNNGEYSHAILGFDFSAEEFFEMNFPESFSGWGPYNLSIEKYGESSIAVTARPADGELHELWVMKEYGVVESWTKMLTLHTGGHYQCFPIVLGFRKNGEVLLQVHDGEMASLDLNSQQMEPQGVLIGGGGLTAVDCSYVESLVLLDKGIDVPAIDSSDSAEWSGEESDMA